MKEWGQDQVIYAATPIEAARMTFSRKDPELFCLTDLFFFSSFRQRCGVLLPPIRRPHRPRNARILEGSPMASASTGFA